jgi:hypothetical protein
MASKKEQQSLPSAEAKTSQLVANIPEFLNLENAFTNARLSKNGYSTSSSSLLSDDSNNTYDDISIPSKVYTRVYQETAVKNDAADFTVRPMVHDGPLARRLASIIRKRFSNDPEELMATALELRNEYTKDLKQETLQLSMLAGKLSLYANMRVGTGSPVLSPMEYAINSAEYGPSFTNMLKKGKALATLLTLSKMRFLDLDNKIDEFNQQWGFILTIDKERKYTYDDFLNEDNLMFFNDPDVNDLKWANEPLQVDENALIEFRAILREVLELYRVPDLQSPERSDTALWTSDSTSWNVDPSERTIHRNIVRERLQSGHKSPFGELTTDFMTRRSIIPVGPANFRDAWEPNFDTLFTIKSISHVMRQVVQPIPYSAMYDANIAYRRKRKLLEKESLFLMLDYKKSAITIPRCIVTVMGEELERIYPNKEMSFIKYYEGIQLYVDGKIHPTLRGVGLGNMNELYTLMQCVFGHFSKKAFDKGSIFFNDDAAYELHSSAYRRQAVLIMSFIRSLGCILNLSKCLISESTIFCEEYRTRTGYDFRKTQLLVLPMLGAMYCPNTAVAKRYMYSIDRMLVGSGLRFVSKLMLCLLDQVYKPEFGKMDHFLPYHLGGWLDFSETNFSCLVEYCLDPWQYLTTPKEQGSIPEIRRWISYHLLHSDENESILSSKAKIAFKGKHLINTEKDFEIFRYKDPLSEYLYGYCGLETPEKAEESADSVINYRGLHNAKPRIKLGLSQKFAKNRYRIYCAFKRYSKDKLRPIEKNGLGLNLVIRSIKSMDDSPDYFGFPRCFLKTHWSVGKGKKNKIVVFKKAGDATGKSLPNIKKTIAATIDSIRSGRWYYRSDPFAFFDYWKRKKSGYLISDKNIPTIIAENYTLPCDFRVFCPNASLFIREFAVRTGKLPMSWHESTQLNQGLKMYMFKDAFQLILPPDLVGEWRDVKRLYSKSFYYLRNLLSDRNLTTRREFKAFIDSARQLYESYLGVEHQPVERYDEDILQILDRFEEENLYSEIISAEYTVEDLLDDEDIYHYSDQDEDYDSDQSVVPMDYEVHAEDDSEDEDVDPGFNEIRRLARQAMKSGTSLGF